MNGLILKDLLNLKKYSRTLLLIIAVYIVFALLGDSVSFISGAVIILSAMMVITSFSYDYMAKWDKYALSLPVTRRDVVLAKYLLGLIVILIGAAVSLAISLLYSLYSPQLTLLQQLAVVGAICGIGLVMISVLFPLIFKFGVEKSRILLILVCLVPTLVAIGAVRAGIPMPSAQMLSFLIKLSPLAVILIYFLSYLISLSIYKKKEL